MLRGPSIASLIVEGSPHAVALGFRIDKLTPGRANMSAPYDDSLVGDPDTGTLHGGVITALPVDIPMPEDVATPEEEEFEVAAEEVEVAAEEIEVEAEDVEEND